LLVPRARTQADLALDLGSQEIRFASIGGEIRSFPSVIAVRTTRTGLHTAATGEAAREMLGRAPEDIRVIRPIRSGLIADYPAAESLLSELLREVQPSSLRRPSLLLAVPADSSEMERRALQECLRAAGAGKIQLIQSTLASAVGAELPIEEPVAHAIIDAGAERTRVAVFSLDGTVAQRSVRIGGESIDGAIAAAVRSERNLWISRNAAEAVKQRIFGANVNRIKLRGRDLESGQPKGILYSQDQALQATDDVLTRIEDTVVDVLEATPPELCGDLLDRGLFLCGGLAPLGPLTQRLQRTTGLAVLSAREPAQCTVRGLQKLLSDPSRWGSLIDNS